MGGRSPYSNPLGSGLDAFTKVVGTFDQLENSKAKREMMAQESADRRLRSERETEVFDRQKKYWNEEDEKKHGQQHLNNIVSVYDAAQKARASGQSFDVSTLSDDQVGSVLYMAGHKGFFGNDGKVIPEKLGSLKTFQSFLADPEIQEAMTQKKKISLDLSKNKKLGDAVQSVFGDDINSGVDRAGNKAGKRASTVLLDFSTDMPTVSFGLEVTPPKEGAGNMIPLPGYEKDVYTAPEVTRPDGQIERGNIDLSKRKVAINNNGSISTVLSTSFEVDGKQVLVPRVSDTGMILTPEEAWTEYNNTGKHLGIFDDVKSADQYAEALHNSKIWQPSIDYYTKGSYQAPMTWGRSGSPDAPVKQIPAPLLKMQLDSLSELGDMVNQLEAKYGTTALSERYKGQQLQRAQNAVVQKAYAESGGDMLKFKESLLIQGFPAKDIIAISGIFEKKAGSLSRESLALDAAGGDKKAAKALSILKDMGNHGDSKKTDEDTKKISRDFFDGQYYQNLAGQQAVLDAAGGQLPKSINEAIALAGRFQISGKNQTVKENYDSMLREYTKHKSAGMSDVEAWAQASSKHGQQKTGAQPEQKEDTPQGDAVKQAIEDTRRELGITGRSDEEIRQFLFNIQKGQAKFVKKQDGTVVYRDAAGDTELTAPKDKKQPKSMTITEADMKKVKDFRAKNNIPESESPDEEILKHIKEKAQPKPEKKYIPPHERLSKGRK